ncbi:MAG TPA: DUF3501 family protein [Polyangia bacterium]|jgi:hypothetical protein|nr:DUF3501 family protein [Polyangia bacterium]
MNKVRRDEILNLGAYEEIRERFRAAVIAGKQLRRCQISDEMSIVFENHTTVLFQIQEMLRTERITREEAIQHELDTYNELIPGAGELSATVFVEIADRDTRERRLAELAGLERAFALEVEGEREPARNETRGVLPDRTTAVHYLKFPLSPNMAAKMTAASTTAELGEAAPAPLVKLIVHHPHLVLARALPPQMVRAIAGDLLGDRPAV